jgi:hypothetical protein
MSRLLPSALGLLLVGSMVVGCGGGDDEGIDLGADRSPVSITSDVDTTTVDVADQDEPPTLETTGDDYETIWRSIHQFEQWMLAHPDSPLGTEIYQPESPAASAAFTLFVDEVQRGYVTRVEGSQIQSVEVVDEPADGTVDLRYTESRVATERIDAETGEVLDRQEFDGDTFTYEVRLRRGFDGKWRVETSAQVDAATTTTTAD